MQNKMAEKDVKMLYLLASILLVAVSFLLIYQPNMNKRAALAKENETLKAQADQLEAMYAQKDDKEGSIKNYEQQIIEMAKLYGPGYTQEKDIMFAVELEEKSDMTISQVTFGNEELFYLYKANGAPSTAPTTTETTPAQTESTTEDPTGGETAPAPATETPTELVEGQALQEKDALIIKQMMESGQAKIVGLKTGLTLSYRTTYEGLKKCIDYINTYDERMTIDSVSTTYDATTGNLSGELKLVLYAMLGTGEEYQDPMISGVKIGKEDIFNTLGFSIKKKKKK